MEVMPCTREVRSHAASLLASLKLQRGQAQFCDCVVRQRQSPAHLYPAHRCVLAASSPVLASLVSSTGALVEVQAPCLSDSVLPLVLDYIYTGALPTPVGQQQYCSLFTAACYLQMDELQGALRAWQWIEVNPDNTNTCSEAEKHLYTDNINAHSKLVSTCNKTWDHPLLSCIIDSHRKAVEADTGRGLCRNSLEEEEDHDDSTHAKTYEDSQMHSTYEDSCIKHEDRDMCSSYSVNAVDCCSSTPVSSVNTCSCIQVNTLVQQDWLHHLPSAAEEQQALRRSKEESEQYHSSNAVELEGAHGSRERVLEDGKSRVGKREQHCSQSTEKPEKVQRNREEEDDREECLLKHKLRTQEEYQDSPLLPLSISLTPVCPPHRHHRDYESPSQSSSSSSPSSPLSWGEVPVICHSNRATMLQLAEELTLPPLHPASQVSTSIIRTTTPQPASAGEGIHRNNSKEDAGAGSTAINHYGAQSQDYRTNNKDHVGTQSWDYSDSNPNAYYEPNIHQYAMPTCDYKYRNTGHFGIQNDERDCMDHGLSQMTDYNGHLVHYGSLYWHNDTKHPKDDGISQNKDYRDKTDYDFETKQQRVECSDVSMATAEDEQAIRNQMLGSGRAVISLPVTGSDTGSDSHHGDQEKKEEEADGHARRYESEIDAIDSPLTDRNDSYSSLLTERNRRHKACSLCNAEPGTDRRDNASCLHTTMTDRKDSADICLPVSTTPESTFDDVTDSLSSSDQPEREKEPAEHYPSLVLENISDTEITEPHAIFTAPVVSNTYDPTNNFVDHSYHGHLHYHVIIERPAELLVSHRSEDGEKGVTFRAGEEKDVVKTGNDDKGQCNEAKCVAGVNEEVIGTVNEAETKSLFGEEKVGKYVAVGKNQGIGDGFGSGAAAEVRHEAGAWGGEGDAGPGAVTIAEGTGPTTSLSACMPPSVPDYIPASLSSSLPVSIPSTLSVCLPYSVPALTSTPVHHPYQCSLCDRSFSQRGSLNRHMRSHLGVKPYTCPRCPMTFSRQYRVTEHMRVHQRCTLGEDLQKHSASSI